MSNNIIAVILISIFVVIIILAIVFLLEGNVQASGEQMAAKQQIALKCKEWRAQNCESKYYNDELKTLCEKAYGTDDAEKRCREDCFCP